MGFDLDIRLDLHIDSDTGLPVVYVYDPSTNSSMKVPYNPEDYKVPEEFCKYLQQRGSQFHYYIAFFGSSTTEIDASAFLHYYPKWEDVVKYHSEYELGGWSEEDHNGFKKALEWMATKNYVFNVHWSY